MKYLIAALAVLAVTVAMLAMHLRGSLAVSRDLQHQAEQRSSQLDASLKASEAARSQEHEQSVKFQAAAQQYEQDKTDAQDRAKKLAADLRAERVRLSPVWECKASDVPAAATSAGHGDAGAELRAESASRIIGNAAEADAQIRQLQALLRAERQ